MKILTFIIVLIAFLVLFFFFNKKNKVDYFKFDFKNKYLICEALMILIIGFFFGKNYFSFSCYVLSIICFYFLFISTDIKEKNEEERTKETAIFFIKKFIIIFLLNIPIYFISNLKIIGYTFFSLVAILVIILIDTMYGIKKKEIYTLKTPEEIQALFPNYDINNLYNALYSVITSIKTNYMNSKVDDSIYNLSEDLYNEYKTKEKNNIAKKQKELFEDLTYVSCALVDYDTNTKVFKAELVYSYRNYVVDINTGNVLAGTPMFPKRYTFLVDFKYTDKVIVLKEKQVNVI